MEDPSVRTRLNAESRVSRHDFGKRRDFCTCETLARTTALSSRAESRDPEEVIFKPSQRDPSAPLGMTVLSVHQKSSLKTSREDLAKQLR